MLAIKKFLLFSTLFFSLSAQGQDETWGIYQFAKKLPNQHIFMAEWLRRDQENRMFSDRFFDYFRFSYGKKYGDFVFLAGGGFVDFESRADEKRFHQFLIYKHKWNGVFLSLNRFALEERFFDGDNQLYLRVRIRNQIDPLPQYAWGASAYNEVFFVPQGFDKFYSGLNENRFGVGPRYTVEGFELYLYYTQVYLRPRNRKIWPTWIQLQARWTF